MPSQEPHMPLAPLSLPGLREVEERQQLPDFRQVVV